MAELLDNILAGGSDFFRNDAPIIFAKFWTWLADLYDKPLDTATLVAINSIGVALLIYASDRINKLVDEIDESSWMDGSTYADPQITGFARAMSVIQGAGMLNFIALVLVLFDRPDAICHANCVVGAVEVTPLRQLATTFTMLSGVIGMWGAVMLRSARGGLSLQAVPIDTDAGEVFSMPPDAGNNE